MLTAKTTALVRRLQDQRRPALRTAASDMGLAIKKVVVCIAVVPLLPVIACFYGSVLLDKLAGSEGASEETEAAGRRGARAPPHN